MYESIKGTLKEKEPAKAIVETAGIAYRLSIPLNTYTRLPHLEGSVHLYLSQVVREDAHTLYAFDCKENRDLFEVLLTVSGIGPKTALAIVGHMEISAFHQAIRSSDIRLLSKLPGIGKKTAERLIIDMRDKLKGNASKHFSSALSSLTIERTLETDAANALINLGYHPLDAQKAVASVRSENEETDLGRLITAALQNI
jgi:Holliday junction DNA helicase RuvA